MHNAGESAGFDSHVLEAEPESDASNVSEVLSFIPCYVTLGDIDIPCVILDGEVIVQAPLRLVFQAFAEDLSEFVRDMEIRISEARSTALSLDYLERALHGTAVAEPRVGRHGKER